MTSDQPWNIRSIARNMPSKHTLFTGQSIAMMIARQQGEDAGHHHPPHPFSSRAPRPTAMRRTPAKISEKARSSVRAVDASNGFTNSRMTPAA